MTTIPGLYCAGEANFSDHGANRLGASALMQGLADGYFVLPYTIGNYLAPMLNKPIPGTDHPEFAAAEAGGPRALRAATSTIGGTRSPDYFHRELGKIIWDYCGMERTEAGPARRRCPRSPRCTRSSRRTCASPGDGDERQPDAGEGRPGRRLLRARDADVPRRARAAGELRRPLPLRVPDRGGRGAARRRALRPRRGVGVDRRPDGRRRATRRSSSTRPSTSRPGATSERSDRRHEPHAEDLAPGRARTTRGPLRDLPRSTRSATRRRSSRCSTSSTSG